MAWLIFLWLSNSLLAAQAADYQSSEKLQNDTASDADEAKRMAALAARDDEIAKLLQEGVDLWHQNKGPEAIDKFQQVVRLDPQNAEGFNSLGVAMEAQGNFVEAEKCYRKAMELNPDNKDFAKAAKALEKRANLQSEKTTEQKEEQSLMNDAVKAYQSGEYLSAIDLYKQLDDKNPNDPVTKYNIGTIYLILKRPVSALEYYKQAAKLSPHESKYKLAIERLEAAIKNDEAQRMQAEKAWDNQPTNLPTGGSLGPRDKHSGSSSRRAQKKSDVYTFETNPLEFYGLFVKNGKAANGDKGIVVTKVIAASRAAQVGLQVDDVLVAVDNKVVSRAQDLKQSVLQKPPGQRFRFTVERNHQIGQVLF